MLIWSCFMSSSAGRSGGRRGSCGRGRRRPPPRSGRARTRRDPARRAGRVRQEPPLQGLGKDREVVAEERAGPGARARKRALGVAAGATAEAPGRTARRAPPDASGHERPVGAPEPLVPGGDAVAVVPEEELVRPLAREHDLHVVAGQARDEVERARSTGRRWARPRARRGAAARARSPAGRHDDLAMLGARGAGGQPRVGELVRLRLREADGEGADRLLRPAAP